MSTMIELFNAAGYNYKEMQENVFYPVNKNIKIKSIDIHTGKQFYDKVVSVVYKGTSKGYNVIINGIPRFQCTPQHRFYNVFSEKFETAENLYPSFIGIDKNNNNINIELEQSDDLFPVLDLEIENSHTYLSAGILSHNTFGGQATVLSNGLRMINPYLYNNKCSLIMISQERANVGVMYGADFKGTGGYAPRFYASWMSRVTRTGDIVDPTTKELIGIEMRVRNTKNKIGIPKRDANLKLYFNSGIDSDDEYIDYLKTLGLITQKGAYFSNENWVADNGEVGMKVCGLDAVANYLHDNPKLYEQVKDEVNRLITGYNILDSEEKFYDDEEQSIINEMNKEEE